MADFPALPLWTDAYIADTTDLSAEEHGVYLLLLMAAWRSPDCSLPDDDERLCRMARVGIKKWRKLRVVMERFWTVGDHGWTQKRLLEERARVEMSRSQKSRAGKNSALKRKKTPSTGVGTEQATKSQHTISISKDSVPDGTGACRATDPAKLVFDAGVKLLGSYNFPPTTARKLTGKWRKGCRDPDLLAIFAEAGSSERGNIVEYIEGCLKNGGKQRGGNQPRSTVDRRREMLEGLEDAEKLAAGAPLAARDYAGRA